MDKPIPAENNPRRVFNRLFRGEPASIAAQRDQLRKRIKLVDAVLESARSLNRQLGQADREKLDQYLTSLDEVESRLAGNGRLLVRYSGTEPLLRVMLEGQNQDEIRRWGQEIIDAVKEHVGAAV